MVLNLYSRRNKRYCRLLAACILIYTCAHYMYLVGSENYFSLYQKSKRTLNPSAMGTLGKIQATPLVFTKSKQNDSTKRNMKTDEIALDKEKNESFRIVYSEKEMQVQLRAIHEHGERVINLIRDTCQQHIPQCLIIGNYKSGTQELLEFMYMHPRIRIYREPLFELNFFGGKAYDKGLDWYRKQMPCSYTGQITVEKSPSYFQEPDCPERIQAMNPEIKLIALVREPIERTLSHFSYSKHISKKYKKFEDCAIDSGTGNITRDCFFIKHSIYDEGMDRYLRVFNRSQIKIIDSTDFNTDPFKVLKEIETFLGIEHIIDKRQFVFIKEKGFYCIRSVLDSNLITCYDHKRGRKAGEKKADRVISEDTMKKLIEFFKPRNDRFFQQTGQTFDWQYDTALH